jgi:death-on-curing protein
VSATPENCFHLTVEIVREIHQSAIRDFGGSDGIRENALLESAVAAPQATWKGKSIYESLKEIAGVYLYYICRNYPFLDGNKITALGACLVFLRLNGVETNPDGPEWEQLVLDVAASRIDREEATKRLGKVLA